MKTMGKISVLLLNIFYLATMGITILILHFGYAFEPYNYVAFAAGIVAIIAVLFYFAIENTHVESKLSRISVSTMFLTTLIFMSLTIFFFAKQCPFAGIIIAIAALITSSIIVQRMKAIKKLRTWCIGIFIVLSYPMLVIFALVIVFSNFGATEIQKTELSPDKQSEASIIYSDQGALGGDTFVRVYKYNKDINVFIGKLFQTDNPKNILIDEREKEINIYWEDNDTLNVNGKSFDV
jgi:hypothetical protein